MDGSCVGRGLAASLQKGVAMKRLAILPGALVWVLPAIALLFEGAAFAEDEEAAYPEPELMIRGEDTSTYVKAGTQFLKEHPESRFAPRVAFGLSMVGAIKNDAAQVEEMKATLLLDLRWMGSDEDFR